jgi:hypothetical protein
VFCDCARPRLLTRRPVKVVAVLPVSRWPWIALGVAGGGASRSTWDRLRSASVYSWRLTRRLVVRRQSFGFLRHRPATDVGRFLCESRDQRFRRNTERHRKAKAVISVQDPPRPRLAPNRTRSRISPRSVIEGRPEVLSATLRRTEDRADCADRRADLARRSGCNVRAVRHGSAA